MITTQSLSQLRFIRRDAIVRAAKKIEPSLSPEKVRQRIHLGTALRSYEQVAITSVIRELIAELQKAIGDVDPHIGTIEPENKP